MTTVIHFKRTDINEPLPWPIVLDEKNIVLSGLGPDDGSILLGYGPVGQQRIDFYPDQITDTRNPFRTGEDADYRPTFVGQDGEFFDWDCAIAQIEIQA